MTIRFNASTQPLITVGLPVYNGEATLEAVIKSILEQTISDFELIISDNCSTDSTAAICQRLAETDPRIRYIRQEKNIGASLNFKFVLDEARGTYFTWAAADDIRSLDFLEHNIGFLEVNPEYVASTSPNCFEGEYPGEHENLVKFAIHGELEERVMQFLDYCWDSHAIFYSVMRTAVISECNLLGSNFLGFDWAVDLFLVSRGKINRTSEGLLVLGRNGLSNSDNRWRAFRNNLFSWLMPFFRFSIYAWRLTTGCQFSWRFQFAKRLLQLNRRAAYYQLYAEFFPYYLRYVRPWYKRPESK